MCVHLIYFSLATKQLVASLEGKPWAEKRQGWRRKAHSSWGDLVSIDMDC